MLTWALLREEGIFGILGEGKGGQALPQGLVICQALQLLLASLQVRQLAGLQGTHASSEGADLHPGGCHTLNCLKPEAAPSASQGRKHGSAAWPAG